MEEKTVIPAVRYNKEKKVYQVVNFAEPEELLYESKDLKPCLKYINWELVF